MSYMALVLVISAGMVVPIQAGINSQLAKTLGSPAQAAFISFLGGLICMAVYCFVSGAYLPSFAKISKVSPLLLSGGVWGSVMVVTAIFFAPRIGAATLISCLITGQLILSVILDHLGWIGYEQHSISVPRLLGISLLFIGVFLIRRF